MRVIGVLMVAVVQSSLGQAVAEEQVHRLNMVMGAAELLDIDKSSPINNIVVGDPRVIDVNVLAPDTVSIASKKEGFSSILFVDKLGELLARAEVTVGPVEVTVELPKLEEPALPPAPPPPVLPEVTVHKHTTTELGRESVTYRCRMVGGCIALESTAPLGLRPVTSTATSAAPPAGGPVQLPSSPLPVTGSGQTIIVQPPAPN